MACLEGQSCFAAFLLDDPNPSDFGTRLHTKNLKNLPPAAFFTIFALSGFESLYFSITKKHSLGVLFCYGVLGGIRTPDPLVRSQILYPTELQAHILNAIRMIPQIFKNCNTYFLKYFIFYQNLLYSQKSEYFWLQFRWTCATIETNLEMVIFMILKSKVVRSNGILKIKNRDINAFLLVKTN